MLFERETARGLLRGLRSSRPNLLSAGCSGGGAGGMDYIRSICRGKIDPLCRLRAWICKTWRSRPAYRRLAS